MTNKEKAEAVMEFLQFNYNHPSNMEERFKKHFGEDMGMHFYQKFHRHTIRYNSSFTGLIWAFGDGSPEWQEKYFEMIEEFNKENQTKDEENNEQK